MSTYDFIRAAWELKQVELKAAREHVRQLEDHVSDLADMLHDEVEASRVLLGLIQPDEEADCNPTVPRKLR